MGKINASDIEIQREWSERTFGPGVRKGVVEHIKKELKEIEESGHLDLEEWIDVIVLGLDGAWRAGYSGEEIIAMYHYKISKNMRRRWPDWRGASSDVPIEHVRD